MTKHDMLREQYEDTLFALLMEDYIVDEGKKALEENERLKCDDSFIVPEQTRKRCLKTISQFYIRQNIRHSWKVFCKVFSKIAVIATISVVLFTSALAISPSLRSRAFNIIMSVYDDKTVFRPQDSALSESHDYNLTAGWLPDGYSLVDESENSFLILETYRNADGDEITVNLFQNDTSVLNIDTEDANVQIENICGTPALLVEKNGYSQIVWVNEDQGYKLVIESFSEDISTLAVVAENFKID